MTTTFKTPVAILLMLALALAAAWFGGRAVVHHGASISGDVVTVHGNSGSSISGDRSISGD